MDAVSGLSAGAVAVATAAVAGRDVAHETECGMKWNWKQYVFGFYVGAAINIAGLHVTEHPVKFCLLALVFGFLFEWQRHQP